MPFPEMKKKLGFGCMRLPMKDGEVNMEEFCRMVDLFLESGFNYFDTAHPYLDGKSETAIRDGLVKRVPRDSYLLTNKLTSSYFEKEADIRPLFESQLKLCGVEYFDFYLMHSQGRAVFQKYRDCRAYETAFALKEEGLVRHVGISFHDNAEMLDQILTAYPQIEAVQIQFNYADYENPMIESRKVYEMARRHGTPVLVMEPVKGGLLTKLPPETEKILTGLHGGSPASYAIRFAAGFEGVDMVLSGMSTLAQMQDNISYMRDFQPLSEEELAAVERVRSILAEQKLIPCTGCRYCIEQNHCPQNIRIPDIFACLNTKNLFSDWNAGWYYKNTLTIAGNGKASDCVSCGACEKVCPQHLSIREYLKQAVEEFEKEDA